jgi:serine/threonine protein kinase
MNDFQFSIETLSHGFLTWHRFAKDKIVRIESFQMIQSGNPKQWDVVYPLKFELLFDQKHKHCEEIAKGKYSKVYQFNHLAYKSVRIQNEKNDHSNLRCNIKELIFFHSLHHCNIMKPHRSQIIMEHGTITRIIHEMPLADYHLGEILHTMKNYQDIKLILKQVAKAMQYMHAHQLNHGDLKPQNILLHGKLVQISDFTLTTSRRKGSDVSLGTLYWRSPETILYQSYTEKSDVWSFGVIMLDCLIGRYYFQNAENESDLMQLISRVIDRSIQIPFHLLQEHNSKDAKEFEKLIYKILVMNPLERPSFQDILQTDFFKDCEIMGLDPLSTSNSAWEPGGGFTYAPEMTHGTTLFDNIDTSDNIIDVLKEKLTQSAASFDTGEVIEVCRKFQGFLWDSQWFHDEKWESVLYHILVLLDFKIPL